METKLKQLLKTIKLNESLLSMIFGVITVMLIGILIMRMYKANSPVISETAESTQAPVVEKVGNVTVEKKEDGSKLPTTLAEKVIVEKGENLWMIAEKNYGSGYNWVDIAKENNLKNANILRAGQELKLPKVAVKEVVKEVAVEVKTITEDSYTVVKGDNLWEISVRAYGDGYKWVEVAKANEIVSPNYIEIGQKLKLPR